MLIITLFVTGFSDSGAIRLFIFDFDIVVFVCLHSVPVVYFGFMRLFLEGRW